jgi:riboflavin kinase / FMN adenylyltransferase
VKIHTSFESLKNVKNPVVTIGTFDGVHRGHQSILKRLREIAAQVNGETVMLSFYPHPRIVLYPDDHKVELLSSPEEKASQLQASGLDHLVIYPFSREFSRMPAFDYVRDLLVTGIGAHTVVVGYDHRFGRNREGNHATLLELSEIFGFQVEEIPAQIIDHNNISSTKIRTALLEGAVDEANEYLGYHYSISGTVIQGDQIGRTIGYPTANIEPDYALKLIPANGIYAVNVKVDENSFDGVLSIGVRPTINNLKKRSIEVHILNFEQDIYGRKICLELLSYLREEKKFGSIDELKKEIDHDIMIAQQWFQS